MDLLLTRSSKSPPQNRCDFRSSFILETEASTDNCIMAIIAKVVFFGKRLSAADPTTDHVAASTVEECYNLERSVVWVSSFDSLLIWTFVV